MDLSGMEDLVEDSGPADNELPESIEFNLDDIGTETVSFEEPEDESEGLLDSADEVTTKLDLARAYIDMGDPDGARSILTEVMEEGSDAQKREADTIISQLA
jgi:pilus assembly protein FimV